MSVRTLPPPDKASCASRCGVGTAAKPLIAKLHLKTSPTEPRSGRGPVSKVHLGSVLAEECRAPCRGKAAFLRSGDV